MAATTGADSDAAPRVALLNDPNIRAWIFQVILVVVLAWLVWVGLDNMFANLRAANIASGFGFLTRNAGFAISQTLIPYEQATSTYGRVFLVGLLNTLLVAIIGIILATALGFVVGIARLSNNWIVSRLATVYVETLRNVPLLLQIFVWYFSVLRLLPDRRDALNLGIFGEINIAGWYAPKPVPGDNFWLVWVALLVAIVATFLIARWSRKRQEATGQRFPVFWTGLGLIVLLPLLVYFIAGSPLTFVYPVAGNFGPRGGMRLFPELIGLLLALTTYTATYIAEIVRAGIRGVNRGQTEASYALGLRPGQALRLVIIPQALRIIIPPLTSQYLNLTKNSSLAVAIAYPDLVSVFAGTALNQTGQAVEILLMTMLTYLGLSLLISAFMNWYNSKMALVER
jgi:general L-amino acid transport system permease protein